MMCVKDGKADFVQDHQGGWRITYSTENSLDSLKIRSLKSFHTNSGKLSPRPPTSLF